MPAVFDSLVHSQNLKPHVAWRVSYIVPFILIATTALGMLFLCDDTPTGKWADRHHNAGVASGMMTPPAAESDSVSADEKKKGQGEDGKAQDVESVANGSVVGVTQGEVVVAPTLRDGLAVIMSPHSLALAIPYAFSFGMPPFRPFSPLPHATLTSHVN